MSKAFPFCRVEGCGKPRRVSPNGRLSRYCSEHQGWQNSRAGLPPMSAKQKIVLRYLRDCKAQEWPFVSLDADPRTLRYLKEQGWIFDSVGLDGVRYTITDRGEQALAVYEQPRRRSDGMCPNCGVRPVHFTVNGNRTGYCLECDRARSRGYKRLNVKKPCPRCGGQRHQFPGGSYASYCEECNRELKRQGKQRRRLEQVERAKAGGPVPLCICCHERPRAVHPRGISDFCPECEAEYHSKYRLRKALQRVGLVG